MVSWDLVLTRWASGRAGRPCELDWAASMARSRARSGAGHRRDFPVTRPSANHADRDRHAVEVIWSNRPLRQADDLFTDAERNETPESADARDETPGCGACGGPVPRASTGRPRAYCSRFCQARAYRARKDSATTGAAP